MIKQVITLFFCLFLSTLMADAQKKAPAKPPAVKKQRPAKAEEETPPPPDVERLEDTKIDVAPVPQPTLDSTLAPNDELTTAIKKMLAASNAIAVGISTSERILEHQKKANTNKEMDAFYDRFMQSFKSERGQRLFENIFVNIYRESYTLDEIKQLTAFYSTPIGKKTLEVTPLLLEKTQDRCRQLGEFLGMEVYRQLTAEKSKD